MIENAFPLHKICSSFLMVMWAIFSVVCSNAGNSVTPSGDTTRWTIQNDGSLQWNVDERIPHYDHIEMSGEYLSAVLRYGVNPDKSFRLERTIVWPMLRTIPNNTHGSLTRRFAFDVVSGIMVDGQSLKGEEVKSLVLNGFLTVTSHYHLSFDKRHNIHPAIRVTAIYFPSVNKPVWCERYILKNITDRPLEIMIPETELVYRTDAEKGVNGSYTVVVRDGNAGTQMVAPGGEVDFSVAIQAFSPGKQEKEVIPDVDREMTGRTDFVSGMWNNLLLETPDRVINKAFDFAKIRVSESIYRTAGGLMHGPGGEAYYAAIWANDESEYVAPFFPFLGYPTGNEATRNVYRLYEKFMNEEYKAVPSSIIAEGTDIWHGAGDCGDAAMLAYGGLRYALAMGDKREAETLWPLMEWCLEYCNRKLNEDGVVESDSDELEGRFPSGNANILVSSLYYDALVSAGYLARDLGLPSRQIQKYNRQARDLKKSVEACFGANVEGFDTYSYYKGNTLLRSWICAPLFAGIHDRAEATMDALFSRLWTKDGLLSQTGSESFWDRSTLSALRAGFVAGETDKTLHHLEEYSLRRLLGDHVPYPIEAWPEGNQRHLSGESGLYCRIITEGLFGMRPAGFKSFIFTPRLPAKWDRMALNHIKAFGSDFDILVTRKGEKLDVLIKSSADIVYRTQITPGKSLTVTLN